MKCGRLIHLCMAFIGVQVLLLVTLAGRSRMKSMEQNTGELDARPASTRHLLYNHSPSTLEENTQSSPPQRYEGWKTQGCYTGHIWNLRGMCPSKECLQRLDLKIGLLSLLGMERKKYVARDHNEVVAVQAMKDMAYLRGFYHHQDIKLVSVITDIQWMCKIYGSLLQFGVGDGKFSTALSYNANNDVGEKLVFSDSFRNPSFNSYKGEQINTFLKIMSNRNLTFSDKVRTGQRQAFLHTTYPLDLKIQHLNSLKVPQFRMVFIHSYGDPVKLFMHLENAVCLIRDGGIIVVDNINDKEVRETVTSFLQSLKSTCMSPLLHVRNTLYLCTANWHKKYLQLLLERSSSLEVDIYRSSKVEYNGKLLLFDKS